MARTYTSTLQLRCVKEHACASCGTVYQYTMARKVQGRSGRSAEAAREKCRANVDRTMRQDVDPQPCPTCGLLQPDMVGKRRGRVHGWALTLGVLAAAAVLIVRASDGLNAGPCTWALVAVCGLAALVSVVGEGADPNRDLDANRVVAADRVTAGQVRTVSAAAKRPVNRGLMQADVPGRAKPKWPLAGLVLLAPLVAAAPEAVRSARAWPANDACYPPVVGPGDTTRVYMPQRIASVKGFYRGTVEARLSAASLAAPVALAATTNQNDWGSTIYVKDDEKQTHHRPWVQMTMPADPSLAGRPVDCGVHLVVEYPAIPPGGTGFETVTWPMDDHFPIRLAPPGAGARYQSLWWSASAAAAAVLAVGGGVLVWSAKRLRSPGTTTNAYPAA